MQRTDLDRLAAAARRNEPGASDLLRGVLRASHDAVAIVSSAGVVVEWSPPAERLFGWTSEEIVGRDATMLVTPDWTAHARELLSASEPHRRVRTLMCGVRKDGTRFYAEVSSASVRAADGDGSVGSVAVVRDVTESVLAAAAASMSCSEETMATAIETVARAMRVLVPFDRLTVSAVGDGTRRPLARAGFGPEGRVAPGAFALPGTPHEEAVRSRRPVAVADTSARSFALDEVLLAEGIGSYVVLPLFHEGDVVGTLDVEFVRRGETTPVTLAALDRVASVVTPAVVNLLAFDRQAEALRRLRHLDELKNDFLALITHDMRTPLAVIGAFAETLRDRWDDLPEDEKLESVDAILRNGRNLFRLVEEGLEVAMIESGDFVYEMASLDVGAQLAKTVDDLSARDSDRRIHLSIEDGLPFVLADRDRHWQVVTNLLSNAIKFSPPESDIEVRAARDGAAVRIAVRDHGVGIAAEDVPLLFRKGSRVGREGDAAVRGAGLGLFICKAIVESHRGRIWHEPTPGGGATFVYTLPFAPVTPVS